MAIIKCIECGNNISSLARACPVCGCPAEHQSPKIDTQINDSQKEIIPPIANYDKWNELYKKIKDGDRLDLIHAESEIMSLTGIRLRLATEIVEIMAIASELPIEYIISRIPSQKVKQPQSTTCSCKACDKTISVKAEKCPHCGEPTGVRACPRCGSTDIVILDAVSKTVSLAFLGPLAINTVMSKYECRKCRFKF